MRNRTNYTPGYKRRLREEMSEFIINTVAEHSIFDLEDYENLAQAILNQEDNESPTTALCEYFGLGEWFEEMMEKSDFDVDDFMVDLRDEVRERRRMSSMDI